MLQFLARCPGIPVPSVKKLIARFPFDSAANQRSLEPPPVRGFVPDSVTRFQEVMMDGIFLQQLVNGLTLAGLGSVYGPNAIGNTHTLRRIKLSLIYHRTKNLGAIQLLLGHTKLESTVRYPGIEGDDAREMAEQTEV